MKTHIRHLFPILSLSLCQGMETTQDTEKEQELSNSWLDDSDIHPEYIDIREWLSGFETAHPLLKTSPQNEREKFRFAISKEYGSALQKSVYISKIDAWNGDCMTLSAVALEKKGQYWPIDPITLSPYESRDFFATLSEKTTVFGSAPAYHRLISDFCRSAIPGQKGIKFPDHPKALTVATDLLSTSAFMYTKSIEIETQENAEIAFKLRKFDHSKKIWIDWRRYSLSKLECQWLFDVLKLDKSIRMPTIWR